MLFRGLATAVLSLGLATCCMAQSELVAAPPAMPGTISSTNVAYHSGWGGLQADGSLQGRVVAVQSEGLEGQAGALVTITQNQQVVATAKANDEGLFTVQGLREGVYELSAETDKTFAAYSFRAIPVSEPDTMSVYAAAIPRSEVDGILQAMWSPQEVVEAQTTGFDELISTLRPATQTQQVALRDGRVYGQVAFANPMNIPESHVVKVFQQGQLLANAPVDANGRFSFAMNEPGPIDLVLGGSAYATLGAEVVDVERRARKVSTTDVLASDAFPVDGVVADPGICSETLVLPACGGALPPPLPMEEVVLGEPLPIAPAPACGAGFAGGFSGGCGGGCGGGGGGFGGIGGALLGAGGLAVGIAALVDDDDDDGFFPPPATPLLGSGSF